MFYPREFRIAAPAWPLDVFTFLVDFTSRIEGDFPSKFRGQPLPIATKRQQGRPSAQADTEKFFAEMGTGLWRLKQKMLNPQTKEPLDEMKRAWRHFESVWDLVMQTGVEVQEHENTPYTPGMLLHVVAFQPTEGYMQETILETIRPTVYYKKKMIQMGEVIVATPLTLHSEEPPSPPPSSPSHPPEDDEPHISL